jgi:hypothetical protein
VTIKCDVFFHARLLSFPKRAFRRQLKPAAGVTLSYFILRAGRIGPKDLSVKNRKHVEK